MNEKINAVYCGHKKRIFAFLLDFLCVLILTINLNIYAFLPIVNNSMNVISIENDYYNDLADSELYIIEDGKCVSIVVSAKENFSNESDYINFLDSSLIKFYNNKNYEGNDITLYNESKFNSKLYVYENNSFTIAENVKNADLIVFLENEINKANNILSNQNFIKNKYIKILSLRTFAIILSFTISMMIFYLLVPLLNKKGQTLGKYLLNIAVIDNVEKVIIKKHQTILRFILIYFEYVIALLTFSALFLISFALTIFSKKNYSLHDFICKTTTIDLKTSTYEEKIELLGD